MRKRGGGVLEAYPLEGVLLYDITYRFNAAILVLTRMLSDCSPGVWP